MNSSLNTYGQLKNGDMLKYGNDSIISHKIKGIKRHQRRAQNMSVDHAQQELYYNTVKVKKSKKTMQPININDNDLQQHDSNKNQNDNDEQHSNQFEVDQGQTFTSTNDKSNINNSNNDKLHQKSFQNNSQIKIESHHNTINQDDSGRYSQNKHPINRLQQSYNLESIKLPKVKRIGVGKTPTSRISPLSVENSPQHQMNKNVLSPKKGRDMFETLKQDKETSYHVALMENRIKKLEDEQLRAQKKIQETLERTQKYQKIQDQKNQHKKVLEEFKDSTQKVQEDYRQKILQEKYAREQRVNELQQKLLKEKKDTKDQIDNSIQFSMRQAALDLHNKQCEKNDQYESIRQENLHGRQMRKDLRLIMELEKTEDYFKKQVDMHQTIKNKKQQISDLAKKEIELMQKLQSTIKVQENVVNQLQDKTGLNKKILFSRLPTDVTFTHTSSFKQSFSVNHSPTNNKFNLKDIQE